MRNGQRTLTPELMDIILQATDVVVEMFERVKARDPLEPADAHLVDLLHKLSRPESPDENIFGDTAPSATQPAEVEDEPELVIEESEPTSSSSDGGGIDEITEDEFEALLDELHGSSAPGQSAPKAAAPAKAAEPAPSAGGDSDDITDEEFEALLDDLHGKGQFGGSEDAAPASAPAPAAPVSASSDEEITDDEFEALLDQLHGSGQGPTKQSSTPAEPVVDKTATDAINKAKSEAPAAPKAGPAPQRLQQPLLLQRLLGQRRKKHPKDDKKPHQQHLRLRLQCVLTPSA